MNKIKAIKSIAIIAAVLTFGAWGPMPRCGGNITPENKAPIEWQRRAVQGTGGEVRWNDSYPYAYWSGWVLPQRQWEIDNCLEDILRFNGWDATYAHVMEIIPYCGSSAVAGVGVKMGHY